MIDGDDADFALLASMSSGGIIGVIMLVLAIVFYVMAAQNETDCESRKCQTGSGKLVDGECLCVEKAR